MWELHNMEEEWRFLIIDVFNIFNEQNWTRMLWTVWHEWPSGAKVTFNCYIHCWGRDGGPLWTTTANNSTDVFIFCKEGITHGYPVSMFAYGIGILPLIQILILKQAFSGVEQCWYANNVGTCSKYDCIWHFFIRLQEIVPVMAISPSPLRHLDCATWHNLELARTVFVDYLHHVKVTTSHH
jgi:hypothetical protein